MSPEMFGRIDDPKFQAGAARLRNLIVKPQGPAFRRPGTSFVREVKDSSKATRLIPFTYSTDQTMVVEMGDHYFRFHTQGATLTHAQAPYYVSPKNWDATNGPAGGGSLGYTYTEGICAAQDTILLSAAHGFTTGDPVVITNDGGTLPTSTPQIAAGTTYYAVVVSTTEIKLATTHAYAVAGTPTVIDITAAGSLTSGQIKIHYAYVVADLVTDVQAGGPRTAYVLTNPADTHAGSSPLTDHWYRMPQRTHTVTMTSANPGVVTWVGHGLVASQPISFATTGALPTNVVASTVYYVKAVNSSTFKLSTTPGGADIDTTAGAQSGVHTATVDSFIYEIGNDYVAGDLFTIHYCQSADVLTMVNPNYPPMELRRYGATDWRFAPIVFGALIEPPTSVTSSATVGLRFNISSIKQLTTADTTLVVETISDTDFIAGETFYLSGSPVTAVNDQFWAMAGASGNLQLRAVAGGTLQTKDLSFTITNGSANCHKVGHGLVEDQVVDADLGGRPAGWPVNNAYVHYIDVDNFEITTGSGGASVSWIANATHYLTYAGSGWVQSSSPSADSDNSYVVTSVGERGEESQASSVTTVTNNLYVPGASNTISWVAATDAKRYRVYKLKQGLYGYIGQTETTSFTDDNIGPDLGSSPPILDTTPPSGGATGYPGAVGYFEGRRWFAGTNGLPQDVWATKPGTESDLSFSLPVKDDDRIRFRIAAREASTVRHIVPVGHLMLLTSGGEFRVSPVNSDAITPSSVSVRPQSYVGANGVQPAVVNNTLVFCAARGGHVREMGFRSEANGFVTGDLSLRTAHLFDGLDIADMAYQRSPLPILWFVSTDGTLLGMTYSPEESVGAWHWHDTDGNYESVCVVAEGQEDRVYVVVNRTIDGGTVRYIERMGTHAFATTADAFFVDSGITSSGTTIAGLDHLEGETVAVFADGVVKATATVSGGAITLASAATKVQVGLPITAELQTAPLVLQIPGFGQGNTKNVSRAWFRVADAMQFEAGYDSTHTKNAWRTAPTTPQDGMIQVELPANWGDEGQLWVQATDPTPLTIVSTTIETASGG